MISLVFARKFTRLEEVDQRLFGGISLSLLNNRRAFIRASGIWAAAVALPGLRAAENNDRALVCIYMLIGGVDAQLASAEGIDPALPEMRDLYATGAAAVVANVSAPAQSGPSPEARYRALRFLPGASFTPQWASPPDASLNTLPSGLTLASRTRADGGALAAAAATANFQTQFPATGIGTQLRDAAALLRMRRSFGLSQPVYTAAISGFLRGQPAVNSRILADVSRALASFHRAMLELDLSNQVTTFTDMDFGAGPADGRAQLVFGGSVRGGRIYADASHAVLYEDYTATLSRWLNASPSAGAHKPIGFLD